MPKTAKKNGRPPRAWSYSAGEWGETRVRVFDRGARGLYAEFYEESSTGTKRVRLALGTTDREKAKQKAESLALAFRTQTKAKPVELDLATLFDIYEREVTPGKGVNARRHDRLASRLFLLCFGKSRQVKTLSIHDWTRFIAERRSGRLLPLKARPSIPAGPRAIERDLRYLLATLNFACLARNQAGEPWLDRNPLKGLPMPKAATPRRPALHEDEYRALVEAAPKVHKLFVLALLVAHETGHRIGSIRHLRWSDIDFERKLIRWRGEHDKMAREHITPMTDEVAAGLLAQRKAGATIGDGWIFKTLRSTKEGPLSMHTLQDWWKSAVAISGLPPVEYRGYHSLRRAFASELKHTNLKDLCALGGWKNATTLLTCYIQPDEATQREALASRKPLRSAAR